MSVWTLYFDGLCEPRNPGGRMAWGFVLKIPGRQDITGTGSAAPHPSNTNNRAEYLALGFGLQKLGLPILSEGGFDGLVVRGDSKLVVEQVNEHWSIHSEHLKPLHARCLERLKELGQPWVCEWVPRAQNAEADAQSRIGYEQAEGVAPPERTNAHAHK